MKYVKINRAMGLFALSLLWLQAGDAKVVAEPLSKPVAIPYPALAQQPKEYHVASTATPSGFYFGGAVSVANSKTSKFGPDNTIGGTLRFGYDFSKYLGFEVRGMYGMKDLDNIKADYTYGAYLKPQYPITESSTVYALLGYAKTKISFEDEPNYNGITDNVTIQDGFSYGGGFAYSLNPIFTIFVDALQNIDESITRTEGTYKTDVKSVNIGALYNF